MQILHITYDFGDASAVYRLAVQQHAEGHEVFIYCKRGLFALGQRDCIQSNRLRWLMYVSLNRLDQVIGGICTQDTSGFHSPSLTPANLPNYVRNKSWEIVHIHWIASNFCSLASALRLHGRKFIHLHDLWLLIGVVPHSSCNIGLNKFGKLLQRITSNRHKHLLRTYSPILLAPSIWAQQQAEWAIGNSDRILVTPGIIPAKFTPGPSDADGYWTDGRLRFLHVMSGQDPILKGIDIIVEALKISSAIFAKTVSLTIVGAQAEALFSINGAIVRCVRTVNEKKMISLYRAADYTLIWSKAETFSQSAAESLSCGTPILTHKELPCARFCATNEGSIVAQNNSAQACLTALMTARRKTQHNSQAPSRYHPEVQHSSATSYYADT